MRKSAKSRGASCGVSAVGAQGAAERPRTANSARAGLACLSALLVVACGQPQPPRNPPSPTATGTVDPKRAAEVAVLASYRAEEAAFEAAIKAANPDAPALAVTMADPLLSKVTDNLRADRTAGIVSDNGEIDHHPTVVSVVGDTAVVIDCEWDAAALVYASSGQKVPPVVPAEHVGVRATLKQTSLGVWKVSVREVTEGSCPTASS